MCGVHYAIDTVDNIRLCYIMHKCNLCMENVSCPIIGFAALIVFIGRTVPDCKGSPSAITPHNTLPVLYNIHKF